MTLFMYPQYVIGVIFTGLFFIGWINNRYQMLIALDQWLATCLLPDSYADETISAWAYRNNRKRLIAFINWLFRDPNHCAEAFRSEIEGSQNAREYRK